MHIAAILLAAGEGRRMGGPKALLRVDQTSFLARAAGLLARPGVREVIAVLGHDASRVALEAKSPPEVVCVVNERYREGMLSSILRGLAEAEARGAAAALLHPVDHPFVAPSTVDCVVAALQQGAVIAVPSFEGRRGHPGGFSSTAWPALRAASPQTGARAVMAEHPEWVVHVAGDPGCVTGIDTPQDYARAIEKPL